MQHQAMIPAGDNRENNVVENAPYGSYIKRSEGNLREPVEMHQRRGWSDDKLPDRITTRKENELFPLQLWTRTLINNMIHGVSYYEKVLEKGDLVLVTEQRSRARPESSLVNSIR